MDLDAAKRTQLEAMCDPHAVSVICNGADSLTPFLQRVASIAMAWLMVVPRTFGRSGELGHLAEQEVTQSRAEGKDYVVISRHKI
eukprot:8445122-Pyramimonas_sp.AAC.1